MKLCQDAKRPQLEIIRYIEQGTEEWKRLRLGKVKASKLSAVIMSKSSKTRASYMLQLIAERLTGQPEDSFSSKYMEWGNECEPQARAMYEFDSGNQVEEVAFVVYNDGFGVSPDGLVGDDGLLEIKCPKTTTQIERYLKGVFPADYQAQVQGQMLATGRKWCDFVSFDPRLSGSANYFCVRVYRDDEYIQKLKLKINEFLSEMNNLLEELK